MIHSFYLEYAGLHKIRYEAQSRKWWREEDDDNKNRHFIEVHAEKETRVLE